MDLLNLFRDAADMESYAAGATIFNVGDPASKMYVVVEGEVEIRLGGTLLDRAGPGGLLGEMALIGDHRRSATAVAATDCRLAPITERRFLFLVQQTPFFSLHVMKVMAERIRRKDASVAQAS
jgi:CRP/FNR family cyclic AMP-dependent transcriptional regulator